MNKAVRNILTGAGVVAAIAIIGVAVAKCLKEVNSVFCDDDEPDTFEENDHPDWEDTSEEGLDDVNIAPAQELFPQGEEDEDMVNPTEAGNWSAT